MAHGTRFVASRLYVRQTYRGHMCAQHGALPSQWPCERAASLADLRTVEFVCEVITVTIALSGPQSCTHGWATPKAAPSTPLRHSNPNGGDG